jgi:hypothetical protein
MSLAFSSDKESTGLKQLPAAIMGITDIITLTGITATTKLGRMRVVRHERRQKRNVFG